MSDEPTAGGGWMAAIDAGLAARLQRRALRPGISDPAHGRTLAARLQRATAPTLADDVAHRYGTAALGGGRPPIVHVTPPDPRADAASVSVAHSTPPADLAGPTPPVVRAAERAAEPAFPSVRPLAAAPAIQRRADPGAAAAPVVIARSSAAARPPAADGSPSALAPGATTAAALPRVSPAPTQLRRQLAAEHAEAAPAAVPELPRVRTSRAPPATRGSSAAAHATADASSVAARRAAAGGSAAASVPRASTESTPPASASLAASAAGAPSVVQRRADPRALPSDAPLPVATTAPRASEGTAEGLDPASARFAAAVAAASPAAAASSAAEMPVTAPIVASMGRPTAGARSDAGGAGNPGRARPVVAPRARTAAGVVQRLVLPGFGGAAALLAQAGLALGRSPKAERAGRAQATTTPPAGAPPAELPTMTAPEERPARAADTERIAGQVYEILARRLAAERKQRGW